MRARIRVYLVLALLASILALLPAALFTDMIVPLQDGQPHSRAFRFELAVYKTLAAPPGWASRTVTGWPTAYAGLFLSPSPETAGIPPLAFLLEHLVWAFPLWFALLVLLREGMVALGTRRRGSAP